MRWTNGQGAWVGVDGATKITHEKIQARKSLGLGIEQTLTDTTTFGIADLRIKKFGEYCGRVGFRTIGGNADAVLRLYRRRMEPVMFMGW